MGPNGHDLGKSPNLLPLDLTLYDYHTCAKVRIYTGYNYSALMKLIICHVGHGAGITNEHMTLDLK